jgi:hypothetical protein
MESTTKAQRARLGVLEATRPAASVLLAAMIAVGLSGCHNAGQEQSDGSHAAQVAADRERARGRVALTLNPGAYLKTSNVSFYDQGVVSAVTISNTSWFAVRKVEGEAVWFDAKGAKLGSTTFALVPPIPAGGTVTFSTGDGTMTSETLHSVASAATVTVNVKQVQVVD